MKLSTVTSNKYIVLSLLAAALFLIAIAPFYSRAYTLILLSKIFMFIILSLSWTLFSGSTGYISLATAAFFGVGIYTTAILGNLIPIPLLVLCGGLISLLVGFFFGIITLRLRGVYFTIFSFGLVELIKHLLLWWEVNMVGTRGRLVVRVDNTTVFYTMLLILVALMFTAFFMRRSKYGLALFSIGSCEEAAAHTGINVTMTKVLTFALSAFFIGLAGAIIATRWGYVDPFIAFNLLYSFLPVLMAIFGGIGSLFGPLLGATVFTYLQEILITRFPFHFMLIFGVIMVVSILYLPGGLITLIPKIKRIRMGDKDAPTTG